MQYPHNRAIICVVTFCEMTATAFASATKANTLIGLSYAHNCRKSTENPFPLGSVAMGIVKLFNIWELLYNHCRVSKTVSPIPYKPWRGWINEWKSPSSPLLDALVLHDFDPVAIGVWLCR